MVSEKLTGKIYVYISNYSYLTSATSSIVGTNTGEGCIIRLRVRENRIKF